MDEFGFIARCLAPLAAQNGGAFGLTDDAAALRLPEGQELVLTKDALSEGVHFTGSEPPQDIARKALRVNLSDLAAMGAAPYAYMLALMLPSSMNETWLEAFSQGLRDDQQAFGITLIGGDTTCTTGPLSLSVTMLGLSPAGTVLRRSGAKAGDNVYVTGTIGDAAIGLHIARDSFPHALLPAHRNFLLNRYRIPEPRTQLSQHLHGIASACIDISDGLMQDLEHICTQSGIGAVIEWARIPLSAAARESGMATPETICAGGDDYELLFTAPPSLEKQIAALSAITPVTHIGSITERTGVRLLGASGQQIALSRKGYRHF